MHTGSAHKRARGARRCTCASHPTPSYLVSGPQQSGGASEEGLHASGVHHAVALTLLDGGACATQGAGAAAGTRNGEVSMGAAGVHQRSGAPPALMVGILQQGGWVGGAGQEDLCVRGSGGQQVRCSRNTGFAHQSRSLVTCMPTTHALRGLARDPPPHPPTPPHTHTPTTHTHHPPPHKAWQTCKAHVTAELLDRQGLAGERSLVALQDSSAEGRAGGAERQVGGRGSAAYGQHSVLLLLLPPPPRPLLPRLCCDSRGPAPASRVRGCRRSPPRTGS